MILRIIFAVVLPILGMYGLNYFFPISVPIGIETWFALFLIKEFLA